MVIKFIQLPCIIRNSSKCENSICHRKVSNLCSETTWNFLTFKQEFWIRSKICDMVFLDAIKTMTRTIRIFREILLISPKRFASCHPVYSPSEWFKQRRISCLRGLLYRTPNQFFFKICYLFSKIFGNVFFLSITLLKSNLRWDMVSPIWHRKNCGIFNRAFCWLTRGLVVVSTFSWENY